MKKRVKTLFQNDTLVSVRDYEVEDCINKNDAMHIMFEDKTMTLDPHSLKTKQVFTSEQMPSKFGNKPYRLIAFRWDPNLESDD